MINEPVRMVADYLATVLPGILPTLPIDAGDTLPTLTVTDSTRDRDVAIGRPSASKGISVSYAGIKEGEQVAPTYGARVDKMVLLIRYEGGGSNAAVQATEASYALRAVRVALQRFWNDGSAVRERNGVQLFAPDGALAITDLNQRVDTEPLMTGILLPVEVHDTLL